MNEDRFRNDRLGLRAIEPADADALQACLNDPAMFGRRYLPGGFPDIAPLSRSQVAEIIVAWTKPQDGLALGIGERCLPRYSYCGISHRLS